MSADLSEPARQYRPRPLEIVDTTLREGQQTSLLYDHHKYFFSESDRIELLRALILYGVKFIELFAPVVGAPEAQALKAVQAERDRLVAQKGYTFLLAHVRCHPDDVQAALDAGFDGLNMYIGTSPQSRAFNHGKNLQQIVLQARQLLEDLRSNYPQLILRFSGEDSFRTPLDDLFSVYDAVAPTVDRLGLPDTVGVATPDQVSRHVRAVQQRYPQTALEVHFHDDRGLAVLNALEAVRAGAQYVSTTLLGVGERSGITSMTALLFNLFLERQFDQLEGYHLRGSYALNVLAANKLKMLVTQKEPVSLANRTHTAGVHTGAVLRDTCTYEAHPLDQFGVSQRDVLLGPLSGWSTIHYFLRELHGFQPDEATTRQITARFKERMARERSDSPAELLLHIAAQEFQLSRSPDSRGRHGIDDPRTSCTGRLNPSDRIGSRGSRE